jgi:hypothetical protein
MSQLCVREDDTPFDFTEELCISFVCGILNTTSMCSDGHGAVP